MYYIYIPVCAASLCLEQDMLAYVATRGLLGDQSAFVWLAIWLWSRDYRPNYDVYDIYNVILVVYNVVYNVYNIYNVILVVYNVI